MATITEKWEAFRAWQRRPYEVAPMTEEEHCCHTCGQQYRGNFCPRCGQSARIGRYSFKKALLLFLDVWGLGNRGMFRTLRDLLLRPGYMIRDYLSGMQMAYFPPFKLFFLLTTLSLVVESGVNINRENYFEMSREQLRKGFGDSFEEGSGSLTAEQRQMNTQMEQTGLKAMDYVQRFPNISALAMLLVMSGFLYIFFRKSPNIPDLRFSELLVALVYTSDMYSVYNIVMEFLCLPLEAVYTSMLLPLIPLKQMSGFGWWKVVFILFAVVAMLCLSVGLFGAVSVVAKMAF
ncbi:MAG: DUF3667 domain-containing protein [Prevotella sp.]|nr:DUF3667 domain-containing protein [Prevotella sp.]